MASTGKAPPAVGASLAAFLPKGARAEDNITSGRRDRSPDATRPLSIKNSDCKTIASVLNAPLRAPLPQDASRMQGGFIRGRSTIA